MRPDAAAVDDGAGFVDAHSEQLEDAGPVAALRPVIEPVVDAFPRPKPLRQIAPRDASLAAIQDRVDELPIADLRRWPESLLGKNGKQAFPLLVGERMSVHAHV